MSSERNDLLRYEETVARWLDRNRIGLRGKTVLAAFSGGADSAALLLLLNAMRARDGFSMCAAHVNHKIRGAEAERDARFCETFCAQRGIPFRLLTGDAPRLAAERGTGMEDAARVLRYRCLLYTSIPLVVTNDAHYIKKDEAKLQDILMCIQTGKTVDTPDRMRFQTEEFYIKSRAELSQRFPNLDDAFEDVYKRQA